MKLAYYIKSDSLRNNASLSEMLDKLRSEGVDLIPADPGKTLEADVLLSCGGDGTFLSAAGFAAPAGIPVLGVNFGRMGFLSGNSPESVVNALKSGCWSVEERTMLEVGFCGGNALCLNEMSVARKGAAMLGVDILVDGQPLPTYWADGLLVATSSGSTAYSMSVGGPVCAPDARVLIIAPIAPHNLNVRPLVVPDTTSVSISLRSRDPEVRLTADNRNFTIPSDAAVLVRKAPTPLKRVVPGGDSFISALRSRLLWGEDVRNFNEINSI